MKKLLALSIMAIMLVMLVVPSFAGTIQEEDFMNVKFEIKKANTAWKPDGVLSEGEYYKVDAPNTWFSSACADDANDDYAKNFNPDFYMSWDENYVYFASVYTVRNHNNEWDGNEPSMWFSGAIQMNYSEYGTDDDETFLEYGIGLSSATGALLDTVWRDSMGSGYTAGANKDFFIVNNNNTLTVEVRTPFNAFLSDPKVSVGSGIGMAVVWSIGVEQDYIHTQLASGCTGFGKHATYHAQVKLAAAPEVVTEAPVTEAPAVDAEAPVVVVTTPAAQTADIAGIAILAAVVALVGVAVVSKKRV